LADSTSISSVAIRGTIGYVAPGIFHFLMLCFSSYLIGIVIF
jgi:hypothetical protein